VALSHQSYAFAQLAAALDAHRDGAISAAVQRPLIALLTIGLLTFNLTSALKVNTLARLFSEDFKYFYY
jgi:hypothetical protein